MQRHITSVFSEYETMDNNSANSKQLEYWLKQISNPMSQTNTTINKAATVNGVQSNPNSTANLGFVQWTFMSNNSSHQDRQGFNIQDQISFGKTVNSSIQKDKENSSMVSNSNSYLNPNIINSSNMSNSKNKSYVNAMIALQKKVKTLQDQNSFMRKNLVKVNEQRNRSMSQSFASQQQLKNKIKILEPKLNKIQELIEENKILRQTKQQKVTRIKILQKNHQQLKSKYLQISSKHQDLVKQLQSQKQKVKEKSLKLNQMQQQIKGLIQKNKLLQQMKQKSTTSILQKYKNSLQLSQTLQKQNIKLKNELQSVKTKNSQQIKMIQQKHNNQIKKCQIQFEKLKQNISLKQSLVQEKKRQAQYFRDAYEKKDEQFIELVKSQHKLIEQDKQKQLKNQKQKQKSLQIQKNLQLQKKLLQNQKRILKQSLEQNLKNSYQQKSMQKQKVASMTQQIGMASRQSSVIQMPQTLVPGNKHSFQAFLSQQDEQQDQFQQSAIPVPIQTKSVGKSTKPKLKKSQRKGILSSQSRRAQSKQSKNEGKKVIPLMASPNEHKKIQKHKKRYSKQKQQASFTMKSHQPPRTQPVHRITFEGDFHNSECMQDKENRIINSYYYGVCPPVPCSSFKYHHDVSGVNNRSQYQSIDEAILIQLQKQLLTLYSEQENLLLKSHEQFATQNQRSQYVGRIRQINQQLRIKNQKVCQIKSKLLQLKTSHNQ